MELLPTKTNIDFLAKAPFAYVLSTLMVIGSLYMWFSSGAEKYGIDYAGGHQIILAVDGESSTGDIRKALREGGLTSAVVQSFEGGSNEYAIRLPAEAKTAEDESKVDTATTKNKVNQILAENLGDKVEIIASEYVGPTIGDEMKAQAMTAIVFGLIGMLGYIAYRFEVSFALGAVVALVHDVIVTMGFYLLCGKTLSVATLAAALTVVGYSVNDTLVIFDRVREEFFKQRSSSLYELVNYSLNATLSRTIITSLTTFFSALALFVFGGGAIADLSLFLVVGVVAGSYSTMFLAAPVALAWERFRASDEERLAKHREKQEKKESGDKDASADGVRL